MTKSTQKLDKAEPATDRENIKVPSIAGRSVEQHMAEIITQPQVLAARTIFDLNPRQSELDLTTLIAEIRAQCEKATGGDLSRIEGMLLAQSMTLDALFNKLIARAMTNSEAGYLDASETYLRLALRAQSQARATGETLGLLKNPPGIAFVRQANISHGPQQVNNAEAPAAGNASRVQKSANPPNELLEQDNGKRLESAAQGAAISDHPPMETVGAVNRAKDAGRQTYSRR